MIDEASPVLPASPTLSATLFTASGKRTASIRLLDRGTAEIVSDPNCPDASIAILVRHGIRIFGTLHMAAEGPARFAFDDPLEDGLRDRFVSAAPRRRPAVASELLAA